MWRKIVASIFNWSKTHILVNFCLDLHRSRHDDDDDDDDVVVVAFFC